MFRPLRNLRLPALPCAAWRGHPALAIELRDQHTKPSLHKANSVGRSPARTLPAHRLCVRVRVCVNCGRVRACVREWRVCECETVAPHHAQGTTAVEPSCDLSISVHLNYTGCSGRGGN